MKKPYISIVLPTRNRPDCVGVCLESILKQSFKDFEVIISDNSTDLPCDEVVEKCNDERLKYFRTSKSLGICDNFEFAVNKAEGEWIMLIGDKNIMYRDAVQKIVNAIEEADFEILNFGQDYLSPFDSKRNLLEGKLRKISRDGSLEKVDVNKALESYMSYRYLMAGVEKEWFLGSIYSGGVYSRKFLEVINASHNSNRLFDGIVPDRYGAVEALCMAKNVYWLNDNIIIYNVCGKNTWGDTVKKKFDYVVSFVVDSRSDKKWIDELLIPGVVASVNNIVASDYHNAFYNNIMAKQDKFTNIKEDIPYLLAIVENELNSNTSVDGAILEKQKELLREFITTLSENEIEEFKKYKIKISKTLIKNKFKKFIYFNIVKSINLEKKHCKKIGLKLVKMVCKDAIITGGGYIGD